MAKDDYKNINITYRLKNFYYQQNIYREIKYVKVSIIMNEHRFRDLTDLENYRKL